MAAKGRERTKRRVTDSLKEHLGILGKVKVGEALLWGGLGYFGGDLLEGSGLAGAIVEKVPGLKDLATYAPGNATYGEIANKLIGTVTFGDALYHGATGKAGARDVNVLIPYSLGAAFDPTMPAGKAGGNSDWA